MCEEASDSDRLLASRSSYFSVYFCFARNTVLSSVLHIFENRHRILAKVRTRGVFIRNARALPHKQKT